MGGEKRAWWCRDRCVREPPNVHRPQLDDVLGRTPVDPESPWRESVTGCLRSACKWPLSPVLNDGSAELREAGKDLTMAGRAFAEGVEEGSR